MAIVKGPLFSVEARGKIANVMVHFPWKGRAVVRKWLKPTNPRTAGQDTVRGKLKSAAQGMQWANKSTTQESGFDKTDKARIIEVTPDGMIWNAYLVNGIIGENHVNFDAAASAWGSLTATEQGDWDTAAEGLTPPFEPSALYRNGEVVSNTSFTAGENFFHYRYGLYKLGIATAAPTATPPTYS